MKTLKAIALGALLLSAASDLRAADEISGSFALVGATVHTVSGPNIENGVVLVQGGKITAVGASVSVPSGVKTINLAGKHLYPGFVHPGTPLGLSEISSVRGTDDTTEVGDNNANIRAEVAVNSDSLLIPAAVAGGVLTAHVVPSGGIVSGTSAVITLKGWNWQDMTLAAPVGMHLTYPRIAIAQRRRRTPSDEDFQKQKEKALKALQDIFDSARAYKTAREAADSGGGPRVELNLQFEAMIPLLDGRMPLFLHADEQTQIESALDWVKKEKLTQVILESSEDAQYVAERLAKERIPVILDGVLAMPNRRGEPYDAAYAAAATLNAAGVKVAISDGGGDASNARNLPFHAAMAAAFGLPKDVALRSVTLTPAEILGVAAHVGSIDVGKDATFFVSDGDPLEARTHIERVWIGGTDIDLTKNHQWELYQKYKNRPLPAK
ncbi:MAG: amidohydrolase family protein [Acidobacteriota bacterium]